GVNANFQRYCSFRKGGPRLSPDDQRRTGVFLINSFMRYFVGSEAQYGTYWNGIAQLPAAACPVGVSTCDERVVLTIQKDASQSKLVQRFQNPNALTTNALGGGFTLSDFDRASACTIPYAPTPWYEPFCSPSTPDEFTVAGHLNTSGDGLGGGGFVS